MEGPLLVSTLGGILSILYHLTHNYTCIIIHDCIKVWMNNEASNV